MESTTMGTVNRRPSMTTPDTVHIPAAHFPDSRVMIRRDPEHQAAFIVFVDSGDVTGTMIVDWAKLRDAVRQLEGAD